MEGQAYYAQETKRDMPLEKGALEYLDGELSRLEETIGLLEQRIAPALSQYATSEAHGPTPEPSSQLRGRAERLSHLTSLLYEVIGRIDL